MVTAFGTYDTDLVRWQGGPGSTVIRPGDGFVFADVAWDGGCRLFLADRTPFNDGLRVFDACTGQPLSATPVSTGLPPFSFVLPADPVAAPAPPMPAASALSLAAPYPNPCNPSARLAVEGPADQVLQVRITDLAGRAVGSRSLRLDAAGRGGIDFDGRAPDGRALPAGVYRVTVQGAVGAASRAVTLLK